MDLLHPLTIIILQVTKEPGAVDSLYKTSHSVVSLCCCYVMYLSYVTHLTHSDMYMVLFHHSLQHHGQLTLNVRAF